jgi:hypothetical protein
MLDNGIIKITWISAILTLPLVSVGQGAPAEKVFRVGASAIDIGPTKVPAKMAGFFVNPPSSAVLDHLHSRCVVVDDGDERIAIVVVDVTALPRTLTDAIKDAASMRTGIRSDHILIAATHNHSSPSAITLGTLDQQDDDFVQMLATKIPKGIEQASRNLRPARIGWTVIQDWEHTHTRRWIRRPDRIDLDPLGERNVRANMHPGFQNPDVIGPSGPSDPAISIVAFQTLDGHPIALLANYAQHYYGVHGLLDGSSPISADYFGAFAAKIETLIGTSSAAAPFSHGLESSTYNLDLVSFAKNAGEQELGRSPANNAPPSFVAMMAQGTSGDQQWMDYSRPAYGPGLDAYADTIAHEVFTAYQGIVYRSWARVRMAEKKLTIRTRLPSTQEAARAREVVAKMNGRSPRTITEVYATNIIQVSALPTAEELKLQAISIGDLGITAIPNEVYAITGLKIKAQSPLDPTINMALANGYNGYIPPPEQYHLGGYTTWRWTHFLEPEAEPRIVDSVLQLLEEVSGKPRRKPQDPLGTYDESILGSKPIAYWRLDEFNGPTAHDATGQGHDAHYEDGVAFYLPGPDSRAFSRDHTINRAPHLAGGRLRAELKIPADHYSAELWFWNGLPTDVRGTTGWLLATASADSLGIGGTAGSTGRLIFASGRNTPVAGKTAIAEKTWNYVVLVRDGSKVNVYLNGRETPEISATSDAGVPAQGGSLFVGGRADPVDSFEGKIDEVAIYDGALSPLEISDHFRLSGMIGVSRESPP